MPNMPPPKEHLQITPTHPKTPLTTIPMDVKKMPTKYRHPHPTYPNNPEANITCLDPTITFGYKLVEGRKHGQSFEQRGPKLKPLITPPITKAVKEYEEDTPLTPVSSHEYSGKSERTSTPVSP